MFSSPSLTAESEAPTVFPFLIGLSISQFAFLGRFEAASWRLGIVGCDVSRSLCGLSVVKISTSASGTIIRSNQEGEKWVRGQWSSR